jgi:hypothetical protein
MYMHRQADASTWLNLGVHTQLKSTLCVLEEVINNDVVLMMFCSCGLDQDACAKQAREWREGEGKASGPLLTDMIKTGTS